MSLTAQEILSSDLSEESKMALLKNMGVKSEEVKTEDDSDGVVGTVVGAAKSVVNKPIEITKGVGSVVKVSTQNFLLKRKAIKRAKQADDELFIAAGLELLAKDAAELAAKAAAEVKNDD